MSEETENKETQEVAKVKDEGRFFRRVYDFSIKTTKRKIASALVGLSVLIGTFRGTDGGLPPIYNPKTGNSYGINIGLVSHYKEGASYSGLNISLIRTMAEGTLNGVGLIINGLEVSE